MEVNIITIGNSKGIRIPKAVLEEYHINEKLEMTLEKNRIVLTPKTSPRKGWEKSFRQMHANGEDNLFIKDVFDDENLDEWK